MNNYWRKKRLELIADGLHIDRDELARFIGPTAHLVLHSTGDVTAVYPFNRAKLKGENPEQFATQAAVARAKREAMDYADDRDAVTVRHVDRQVGDLAKRVNDVTNRVAGLEKREPTAAATGPSYFAEIDYGSFSLVLAARQEIADLRREIVRISEARDDFRDRMYRQAETINAMQGEANSLNATAANLERERDNAREGRDKAIARCIELEAANKYLYALLGANL